MKKTQMVLGVIVLWGVLVTAVLADTKVIISEGKFVMGDLDNKQDAKQMALLEAKRAALDKAGTYLTSTSVVKNYTLSEDQITSLAAGIVGVAVLDEQWNMAGEAPVVVVKIQATIDTSDLEEQINQHLENSDLAENVQSLEKEMDALRQQIAQLESTPAEVTLEMPPEIASETTSALPGKGDSPEKPALPEAAVKRQAAIKKIIVYDKLKAAQIAINRKQTSAAIELLTTIIQNDQQLAPAYLLRGRAYAQAGQRLRARRDLEKACKLGLEKACNMVERSRKKSSRPQRLPGARPLKR